MNDDLKTPNKGDLTDANVEEDPFYESIMVVPQLTSSILNGKLSGTSPTLSQIKSGMQQILEESPSIKKVIMSPAVMSESGYSCTSSVVDWKDQVRIERQIRK